MSTPQRIGFVAGAAGAVLFALFVVRHAGVQSAAPEGAEPEPAAAPEPAAGPIAAAAPASSPPPSPSSRDGAQGALTPTGDALSLKVIMQNEQMRVLFARLQSVGLSREQMDRVVLILGANALRTAPESPTLLALRARGPHVLSPEEAARVRVERQQIADRTLRSIRPALGAVLTPAQMDQAGLGDATSPGARAP